MKTSPIASAALITLLATLLPWTASAETEEATESPAQEAETTAEEQAPAPVEEPPAPSSASCTYRDLHNQFEITAPCDELGDHSNNSQPHKRMWLAGPLGQLQIMEVPEPFRGAELDFVMENLGRFWTKRHTPGPVAPTEVGGQDARVVTERKMRTTSRTWVFSFRGRNLTVRGVAYGRRAAREERLERLSEVFLTGFRDLGN
ncbi:MAG TPA: hypothetical protein DIU15_18915 [Deltaproteobacteria bacterium]|nr:hypothetical protein [Deltaproteobacteria bacterium]